MDREALRRTRYPVCTPGFAVKPPASPVHRKSDREDADRIITQPDCHLVTLRLGLSGTFSFRPALQTTVFVVLVLSSATHRAYGLRTFFLN